MDWPTAEESSELETVVSPAAELSKAIQIRLDWHLVLLEHAGNRLHKRMDDQIHTWICIACVDLHARFLSPRTGAVQLKHHTHEMDGKVQVSPVTYFLLDTDRLGSCFFSFPSPISVL